MTNGLADDYFMQMCAQIALGMDLWIHTWGGGGGGGVQEGNNLKQEAVSH